MLKRLWSEETGAIVSAEIMLVMTILVIGVIVGLKSVRDSVVTELADVAQALGNIDQTERNQDRDFDEDHPEIAGVEPDRGQDRPADRLVVRIGDGDGERRAEADAGADALRTCVDPHGSPFFAIGEPTPIPGTGPPFQS